MAGKVCQICGKSSGIYPLCKEHLILKNEGKVIKDSNGKWIECKSNNLDWIDNDAEVSQDKVNVECLLCGAETKKGYLFCRDCYYDLQARIEELDKNQKPTKLKDYYYNAKDYAMRIYDEDKIYYQQLTMLAISDILKDLYDDDAISERVLKDIDKINENLKNKNEKLEKRFDNIIVEEIKQNTDTDKAKIKKTQDGHFVESEYEIKVDDLLYTNSILHAYNIKVDEITERAVYCDWYIPVLPNKGIYIELWGVKGNEKYNKNKQEKVELYNKHNLYLIEVEYDELRNDTQRLRSSLREKINTLKNKIIDSIKN